MVTVSSSRPFSSSMWNACCMNKLVYFRSSLRAQTAKTLVCTKSGVSADSRKSAKKCGKPHFYRKKCALLCKKCGFPRFLALFLESAETPLFVQINVFAVWALRLDRKYTRINGNKRRVYQDYFCVLGGDVTASAR